MFRHALLRLETVRFWGNMPGCSTLLQNCVLSNFPVLRSSLRTKHTRFFFLLTRLEGNNYIQGAIKGIIEIAISISIRIIIFVREVELFLGILKSSEFPDFPESRRQGV